MKSGIYFIFIAINIIENTDLGAWRETQYIHIIGHVQHYKSLEFR
jgi:hypothetical protein